MFLLNLDKKKFKRILEHKLPHENIIQTLYDSNRTFVLKSKRKQERERKERESERESERERERKREREIL